MIPTPEHTALNGLLTAMAGVERAVAMAHTLDITQIEAYFRVRDAVESMAWCEHVQLARALIAGGAMGEQQGRG